MFTRYRRLLLAVLLTGIGWWHAAAAVHAQTMAQAYQVDGNVRKGMIVMLKSQDSTKVQPLTNKKEADMQGVIVAANETVISFGEDSRVSQVYVASKGKYDVLVSTQNGSIKTGDLISISSLDGVGMKADATNQLIVGRALSGFDGNSRVSGYSDLTTSTGKRKVAIGLINTDISVSHNPLAESGGSPVPLFLKRMGETVAGRSVSPAKIYLSLAILVAVVIMSGSILYGGVKSTLTAIGRNPLARNIIFRGLFQVLFISLIIFAFGIFAIYLLLRI